jgi:replicative DNA helicase
MSKHIANRFPIETIIAGLFRLIHDKSLLYRYSKYLESEWFYRNDNTPEITAIRKVINVVKSLIKEGHIDHMSLQFVEDELPKKLLSDEDALLVKGYYSSWLMNKKIEDRINDSGCFQSFLNYLKVLQIAKIAKPFSDDYQIGNIDKATRDMQEVLSEINQIGRNQAQTLDFKTAKSMLDVDPSQIDFNRLYLGNSIIDDLVGGYARKTLNLWIAPTGGGKTAMLHHIIRQCLVFKKYAHILCVEDRVESFLPKVVSAVTGISSRRIEKEYRKLTSQEQKIVDQAFADLDEYIQVDFVYGCHVDTLHKMSKDYDLECELKGKPVPEVNAVDYTQHIAEKSFGEKMYIKMRNAYGARKDFILENNKIGIDFAQVNRTGSQSLDDAKMLTHNDLAGGFDIAQVCDNIMTINRSTLDINEYKANLHVCKSRDGPKGYTVRVGTNFGCTRYNMEDSLFFDGPRDLIDAWTKNNKSD